GSRSQTTAPVFFFQAVDGIRDRSVTGVQTCALPISAAQSGSCTGRGRSSPPTTSATSTASSPTTDLATGPRTSREHYAGPVTSADRKSVVKGKRPEHQESSATKKEKHRKTAQHVRTS